MALKMAFTDASGNINPNAYWRPAQVNVGVADGNCNIVFYAYKDADASAAHRVPLPGATHSYFISGSEFAALYAQHIAPNGPNLFQMVYAYAKAKLDTDDGQGGLKSFFADATDI